MDIIAHEGAIVNINVEIDGKTADKIARANIRRQKRREDAKKGEWQKWEEHKKDAQKVGARLIDAGLKKRGNAIKMCNNSMIYDVCADCGKITVRSAGLCRDRLCPICNWRLSVNRYAQMQRIMQRMLAFEPNAVYSLATLTVRNCEPQQLKQYMTQMQEAWNTLLQQRWLKPSLIGWARSIEVTYNAEKSTLHPHYHVIFALNPLISPSQIITEWLRICGTKGLVADIKAQNAQEIAEHTPGQTLAGAICEVYKYAVKSSDTLSIDLSTLRDLASGIAGKRLISMGGKLKEIAADLKVEFKEDADETDDTELCTECGCTELDEYIAVWSFSQGRYLSGRTASEVVDLIKQQAAEILKMC